MFATKKPFTSTALRLAAFASALAVVVPLAPAPAHALACGKASGCTAFELVHAGASYNWYPVAWRYEFKGGRQAPKNWKLTGKGRQYQQNGMLTLVSNSGLHTKPVASTWSDVSHTRGRWESRIRTRSYGDKGTPFRVQLSLVPTKKSERACGAQDVTFLDYTPKKASTVKVSTNTLPASTYTYSKSLSRKVGGDEWHVFGVEVTAKRIAWFIDAKVVAVEKRPAALSGVDLRMQARLVPTEGATMKKTRLQLDWARYWTMKKKGKALGKAAALKRTVNKTAC